MDFQDIFNKMPKITRAYLVAIVSTTILISFNLLPYHYLILTYDGIFDRYWIWTLISNTFIFGKFSFQFVFQMFFLYFGFSRLEKFYSPNRLPEFVYLLLVNYLFIFIISLLFDAYYMMGPQLAFAVLYIWCKKEPMERVQFMFGIVVNSAYFPWVVIGWTVLTGGNIINHLIGVASGHLYIFLKDVLPASPYKYNFLKTPKFIENIVNKYYYVPNNNMGQGQAQQDPQQQGGAHRFGGWRAFGGHGVRLQ
jgi:Derlin-2/3